MTGQHRHEFGSASWTEAKLKRVEDYLNAYMKIMTGEKGRWFMTWYVDAFAGTGYSTPKGKEDSTRLLFPDLANDETQDYIKGSAWRALEIEQPFDRYLCIEKQGDHCDELHRLKERYPKRADAIEVVQGDANECLLEWCNNLDRAKDRAVVFLDPYGMQVEWRLIEAIAATQSIDLWLLFPESVIRTLRRDGKIPGAWQTRLTRFFGTDTWREKFYKPLEEGDAVQEVLFGEREEFKREVGFESINQFFVDRLKTAFPHVAEKPLTLTNSRGNPLFLLCFAAGNPKGGKTALKIAQHLLKMKD